MRIKIVTKIVYFHAIVSKYSVYEITLCCYSFVSHNITR